MKYTKLSRVTKDIGLFGKKGAFKTTIAVMLAYLEWRRYGTKIFSNIKKLKFPHTYCKDMEALNKIKGHNRKMFIGDDFERWFFSRNWSTNIKLNNILLDWGKLYCSTVYTAKREKSIDVGLRESTCEFWELQPKLRIKSNTGDRIQDKINNNILKNYAEFLYIHIDRYNEELELINPIKIYNVQEIFQLFDTFEVVKHVS